MNSRAWQIGQIKNVPILVNRSTLLMALVLIYFFENRIATWSNTNAYLLGLVLAIGLYVSVLIHELSHMFTAQTFGYQVERITLHFLGGETLIAHGARKASHEFWIGLSGPLSSGLIGIISVVLSFGTGSNDISNLLLVLGSLNLLLALMNLLPALPLDGGRALRGLVWLLVKDRNKATLFVAFLGRVLVIGLLALLLIGYFNTAHIVTTDIVIAIIMGSFIWAGSSSAAAQARSEMNRDYL